MSESLFEELNDFAPDEELDSNVKLKAHDLFVRLESSFPPPAYVTIEEVRDATGFDGHRTADAIAISLYRSRGKKIWGFEFKVSRNDWLKELKQPEKAESILRYCHHWALVIPDRSIVKDGELPSTWGLYVAQKTRLKCIIPPPLLEPLPMSMTMLTALIYAVNNRKSKIDAAALTQARDEGYKEGVSKTNSDFYEKEWKKLDEKVKAFDLASGLNIRYGWEKPDKVGSVVKLILDGQAPLKSLLDSARYNLRNTEDLKLKIEKQIGVLESAMLGVRQTETDEE